MSIRNDVTNRHEDDLWDESMQNEGRVSVLHLVEHLEEICGLPEVTGANVAYASRTAAFLIRALAMQHPEVLDINNAEVPYCKPRR